MARVHELHGGDLMPKRPVGRPVTTGRGDGARLNVRVSAEELAALTAAASRDGAESVAAWVRDAALRAAQRGGRVGG